MTSGRAAGFEVLQIRHPNEVPEVLRGAGILGNLPGSLAESR
jgi:hypothetical protein